MSNQELRELILNVAEDLKRYLHDTLSEEIIPEHDLHFIEGYNEALRAAIKCVRSYAYDYYPPKHDNEELPY